MHIKRKALPKTWPVKSGEGSYIVVGKGKKMQYSTPITIIMRDMLGIAKTKREVRSILKKKQVLVNNKEVEKTNSAVGLFDIIEMPKLNKKFIVSLNEKGKLCLEEKTEQIAKVIGRSIIKGKKQQINLFNGGNIISNEKIRVGDSVVLKNKKIMKVLPLEKNREAIIIRGKHIGQKGKIKEIDKEIIIKTNKEEIKADKDSIFIIG